MVGYTVGYGGLRWVTSLLGFLYSVVKDNNKLYYLFYFTCLENLDLLVRLYLFLSPFLPCLCQSSQTPFRILREIDQVEVTSNL